MLLGSPQEAGSREVAVVMRVTFGQLPRTVRPEGRGPAGGLPGTGAAGQAVAGMHHRQTEGAVGSHSGKPPEMMRLLSPSYSAAPRHLFKEMA